MPSLSILPFFFLLVNASNTEADSESGGVSGSAASTIDHAKDAFSTLQTWYNPSTGIWTTTGWWNAANIVTMIGDLAQADATNAQLQRYAADLFANTLAKAPKANPRPNVENMDLFHQGDSISNHSSGNIDSEYTKILNMMTFEPYSEYPLGWNEGPLPSTNDPTPAALLAEIDPSTLESDADPSDWLDGFYDDDLWWALAWINAYDVTRNSVYLHLAEGIFTAVSKVWPTSCFGGGIYWNNELTYVNAIANELFFSTAAHLANRVESREKRAAFEDWAIKSIEWFIGSGMINQRGTINDGLDDNCNNNGQTAWSYNQGVILGGLVELNRLLSNDRYLGLANQIAHAAIQELADGKGVLHDPCEPNCGADGTQFKGVFMRNLQRLHRVAPDELYANFMRTNANSIWSNDQIDTLLSVNWAGPFVRPANASTQSSAMDALVAAITVDK